MWVNVTRTDEIVDLLLAAAVLLSILLKVTLSSEALRGALKTVELCRVAIKTRNLFAVVHPIPRLSAEKLNSNFFCFCAQHFSNLVLISPSECVATLLLLHFS